MLAAHGIEQQRQVLDIARHRAVHGQIAIDLGNGRMRNAADAWPHPDHAAEARGIAQRTAHIRTVGEPRRAGCERDRGAARGAGGGSRQVPGIKRRAEHFVEGIGAGAEFRRVRFGINDPAVTFEAFDRNVGVLCDRILEDRSLIGIGIPASRPRSPTGFFINALAWVRARSKHSVGKALTLPSTSAIRCSSTSSRSSGVTSPEFSFSMTAHAVARTRLRSDATCVSPSFRFLPIRPLFRVGGLNLPVIPGRCEASNPESRDSPMRNCASEVWCQRTIPE